jgi:hypothetical protein
LRDKQVPFVDHLAHSFEVTVYLELKGIVVHPGNEEELLEALVCVLRALQVCYIIPKQMLLFHTLQILHQEPPLFHRDIRWANVIRRADDHS